MLLQLWTISLHRYSTTTHRWHSAYLITVERFGHATGACVEVACRHEEVKEPVAVTVAG